MGIYNKVSMASSKITSVVIERKVKIENREMKTV